MIKWLIVKVDSEAIQSPEFHIYETDDVDDLEEHCIMCDDNGIEAFAIPLDDVVRFLLRDMPRHPSSLEE